MWYLIRGINTQCATKANARWVVGSQPALLIEPFVSAVLAIAILAMAATVYQLKTQLFGHKTIHKQLYVLIRGTHWFTTQIICAKYWTASPNQQQLCLHGVIRGSEYLTLLVSPVSGERLHPY
jgi:hypothetical protein